MKNVISILFGTHKPIGRGLYFGVGFGLMIFKYLIDAGIIFLLNGQFLTPWFYLLPAVSLKADLIEQPFWVLFLMTMWTFVFIWIGASMTYRRLLDAGKTPYLTLFFFCPIVNYFSMLAFAMLPSSGGGSLFLNDEGWLVDAEHTESVPISESSIGSAEDPNRPLWWNTMIGSALVGSILGASVSVLFTLFSVFLLGDYGLSLFVGLPFIVGFIASSAFNKKEKRSRSLSVLVSLLSTIVTALTLLLLAFEGVLCVAMLAPFAAVLASIGGLLARELSDSGSSANFAILAIIFLPLLAIAEPKQEAPLQEVRSSVIIEASPSQVWSQVVTFNELPPIAQWFFKLGIAYPIRARLEGEGVGAIRYCEFSTGPFVEPITHWEEPIRLSFDVTEQPATMEEWSFYETINAPHITESLQSRKGEFRLIELENGHTRLEGSTWYTQDLKPYWYWYRWSDFLIHAIHTRVLEHIKEQSEGH
jgi:hypothetical protein